MRWVDGRMILVGDAQGIQHLQAIKRVRAQQRQARLNEADAVNYFGFDGGLSRALQDARDGSLAHKRIARHGVDDCALLPRQAEYAPFDLGIDIFKPFKPLVDLIKADAFAARRQLGHAGVARGTQVKRLGALNLFPGLTG